MPNYRYITIDTNFFISAYGENPSAYEGLDLIFKKLRIKIVIADYVKKEMRWYMRRSIEPFLIVKEVNPSKLKKFEDESRGKVNTGLPQTPDMAVAYLASTEKYILVSSDMRLIEVAQQLGINSMMNSAFLVMLLSEVDDPVDRAYLQELYDVLISDEIMHSVNSQGKYDPVIRIQKIMDSAINVVKQQGLNQTHETQEEQIKLSQKHDFPAYQQLYNVAYQIRTDISDYIELIVNGNYKRVKYELNHRTTQLSDLLVEMRLYDVAKDDNLVEEAITILGHILLLSSTVALGEQRLADAIAYIDQLSLLSIQNPRLEERLDIEIHLQRITIFFLTEDFLRFNIYFTPSFIKLCEKREREDIILLHRTMAIIIAVLSNQEVETSATAKDFSEIQYLIQLGVQFIAMDKIMNAWLLLLQAVHMSINSNMTGLLMAVFEVMLPLSFIPEYKLKPSFSEVLKIARKVGENIPFEEYTRRSKRNTVVSEDLLRKRSVSVKKIPMEFTGFLDVISAETADFRSVGRCTFVRLFDWDTLHFIGLVDPTQSLDDSLTVGSSVKIHEGKLRVSLPSKSIKQKRKVDVLIICKPEDLKFIVRRAGQLQVAQSRVGEYDL